MFEILAPLHIVVIGCGGVGTWVLQALCRSLGETIRSVTLIDDDVVEEGNIARQLYGPGSVGLPKAMACVDSLPWPADRVPSALVTRYGVPGSDRLLGRRSLALVAVDNHATRNAVLEECDKAKCGCIIMANEVISAEAYYYHPELRKMNPKLDPRVWYPELGQAKPEGIHRSCVLEQEAANGNSQTAVANMQAATYGMYLYRYWSLGASGDIGSYAPLHISCGPTKIETLRISDYDKSGENIL